MTQSENHTGVCSGRWEVGLGKTGGRYATLQQVRGVKQHHTAPPFSAPLGGRGFE